MKTALIFAIAVIGALYFWMGVYAGPSIEYYKAQLREAQKEISILRTKNASMEWYIADQQRKNMAFEELIRMEMEETGG